MASTLPLNIDKNLQPGMSGPDVKSLQQWLMDQGLLKIDAPTGFFGDLTKQALAEWQRKSGMQVPAGQEGFFGPLTRSAIQANQATPIEPDTKTATTDYAAIRNDLKTKWGFTDDQLKLIPDSQLSIYTAMGDYIQKQYEAGKTVTDINTQTFQQIYDATKNDPTIQAKYGDELKFGERDFLTSLENYQFQTGLTGTKQAQQIFDERRALAEQEAEAGRAYSGFREQAKSKLDTAQSGIIQSTQRQIKSDLEKAGSAFEQKYGTASLQAQTPLAATYVNPLTGQTENYGYSPIGNVAGTQPAAKAAEIFKTATERYANTQ